MFFANIARRCKEAKRSMREERSVERKRARLLDRQAMAQSTERLKNIEQGILECSIQYLEIKFRSLRIFQDPRKPVSDNTAGPYHKPSVEKQRKFGEAAQDSTNVKEHQSDAPKTIIQRKRKRDEIAEQSEKHRGKILKIDTEDPLLERAIKECKATGDFISELDQFLECEMKDFKTSPVIDNITASVDVLIDEIDTFLNENEFQSRPPLSNKRTNNINNSNDSIQPKKKTFRFTPVSFS